MQPMMEASPPNLVMVEAYPARMKRGGGGSLPGLLKRMAAWGFTDISHAGAHCDERWAALTKKTRCTSPPRTHDQAAFCSSACHDIPACTSHLPRNDTSPVYTLSS